MAGFAIFQRARQLQRAGCCQGGADMAIWTLQAAARNHKGILRPNNEDNLYLNGRWMPLEAMNQGGSFTADSAAVFQLYAVCDGMGGQEAGEQASHLLSQALGALQMQNLRGASDALLLSTVREASQRIFERSEAEHIRSGTTLTALVWQGGQVRVLNVGDSRVYRLRRGRLSQLTVDHSVVQRLIARGELTPEQARRNPGRHIISQYVGLAADDPAFHPYLSRPMLAWRSDRYLLCTDGLTDMVDDDVIAHILRRARDTTEAVALLVQQALDNGGRDNITAMCVDARASWRWLHLFGRKRP